MGTTASQETARRRAKRTALAIGLSLAAHLAVAASLAALSWSPMVPRLDITWLDLDNTLGSPRRTKPKPPAAAPEPEPEPRPQTKKPSRKLAARKKARPQRRPAKPDAGPPRRAPDAGPGSPAGPEVADLAPGDAALILLLRMERIRGTPYEPSVRRLLQVFYDHKTLLWSSGLDPIHDFAALVIATPNPYRVTRTFLAARHALPRPRIKAALERAGRFDHKGIRWQRQGPVLVGQIPSPPKLARDPRVVVMRPGLVALTDPRHIPALTEDPSGTRRPGGSEADAGAGSQIWLSRLLRMGGSPRPAGAPPRPPSGEADTPPPGLEAHAINLPRLIRLPRDIPVPDAFHLELDATAPTVARATARFESEARARAFMRAVPRRIARAKRSLLLRLLGVTDLLDGIRLKRDKGQVHGRLRLDENQVKSLLELARGAIPQVRVPGMPPRRPPDAGPAAPGRPDAGPGARDAGGAGAADAVSPPGRSRPR